MFFAEHQAQCPPSIRRVKGVSVGRTGSYVTHRSQTKRCRTSPRMTGPLGHARQPPAAAAARRAQATQRWRHCGQSCGRSGPSWKSSAPITVPWSGRRCALVGTVAPRMPASVKRIRSGPPRRATCSHMRVLVWECWPCLDADGAIEVPGGAETCVASAAICVVMCRSGLRCSRAAEAYFGSCSDSTRMCAWHRGEATGG